ncbi:VOC family protein [Carnobacterium inhibens]|uniref:VOC family protein n=1 Tax=Carnobacterium inhibens TaxID=147709 RepID=UPI0020423F50|nr:VOC family protein [Carnobacterium inhibens]MCM3513418.1 VOC family protein [Carnobacterium inhibens]
MNRINLICLGVRDMKAALDFYKRIGFQTFEKTEQPAIVFFNNQGSKLELFPIEELAKDINEAAPPMIQERGFNGITLACNVKSENEVDDMMARVKKNGGEIVKDPVRTSWGGYSGYFQDIEGYYWEVAYGPSWKFDENEMLIIEETQI